MTMKALGSFETSETTRLTKLSRTPAEGIVKTLPITSYLIADCSTNSTQPNTNLLRVTFLHSVILTQQNQT